MNFEIKLGFLLPLNYFAKTQNHIEKKPNKQKQNKK